MPLTIAPNEFTQPDFTLWYTANDGCRIVVGRSFHARAGTSNETPWFWSVDFHQRDGRTPPHQGYVADEETAKREWRRCWEFRRRADQLAAINAAIASRFLATFES